MQKLLLLFLLFLISVRCSSRIEKVSTITPDITEITELPEVSECDRLYASIGLEGVVDYAAFQQGYTGYTKINRKSKEILAVIDFSKPSTQERLYVIDIKNEKLLHVSLVSHGQNSGENYATSFSNVSGSHKSSLGFYVTENTYQGGSGYSLIIDGLEKGINDKAKARAIVIHGAAYANPSVIARGGRLGRSHGCPALPQAVTRDIIDTIKGGALLYIYANDDNYLAQSPILSVSGSNPTASASICRQKKFRG